MRSKKWRLTLAAFSILLAAMCIYAAPSTTRAQHAQTVFSTRTLVQGSYGADVYELQARLKHLGYYHGKLDSSFGWDTYWAVRRFQYRFGMHVDGRVGWATKMKLARATHGFHPWAHYGSNKAVHYTHAASYGSPGTLTAHVGGHNVSANDMKLMANAVYGEARGEPFIGQVAIAAVILNRLDDPKFPHTVPEIIFQPGAFTATQDGQIYLTPNAEAMKAVHEAVAGWDPSDGATYYFNPATATSSWIWSRPQIKRIGHHIFCR